MSMSAEATPRERAAIADPEAREFLRKGDPVLARLIDARPDFRRPELVTSSTRA
jgi:hypothetical protein